MSIPSSLFIGLTGGIGSGKSTVGHMLLKLGAKLIDTDAISRSLTAPGGRALLKIAEQFGPHLIDQSGAMDREQMRTLVFQDPSARLTLESILHPLIHDETEAQALQAAPGQPVVFDVPLLAEAGLRWRNRVQRILVVDCPVDVQIERVMARSGWTRDMVERVIAQQATRETRLALADDVIVNHNLSLEALADAVQQLWNDWPR
jgi:dephospho-CoA kinase